MTDNNLWKEIMYSLVKIKSFKKPFFFLGLLTLGLGSGIPFINAEEEKPEPYATATGGTVCFGEGCGVKILLEAANFGSGELEMAEITFSAGYEGRTHPHTSTEIFYVLSGTFGHEMNGVENFLPPGMVGVVKPGDMVRHSVPGEEDARVLVIWIPGGEIDRIFDRSGATPINEAND